MAITEQQHQAIADFLFKETAIVLDKAKDYLVEARLNPLLRNEQLTLDELVKRIYAGDRSIRTLVIDALTTNETFFFREMLLFDELRDSIIPEMMGRRKHNKTLNLWCAACSSGQEAYSVAMLLRKHFPALNQWRLQIIASDVSEKALNYARKGIYNQIEINRGLPKPWVDTYFHKSGVHWEINDDLKRMVEFRKINLNDTGFHVPKMDIILVRNVMIYFSKAKKTEIFDKLSKYMRPDGLMFLSATESAMGVSDKLEMKRFKRLTGYALKNEQSAIPKVEVS